MFTFFKSKPLLRELIPQNHIDIHSHLLPGIDDGAQTFKDTLALTTALQSMGITELVAKICNINTKIFLVILKPGINYLTPSNG